MTINSKVEMNRLVRTISFRVDGDVYKSFESQCVAANMSKSELFRGYIIQNKIYVKARPVTSRESRRAVALLQTASNSLIDLLRRANSDKLAGALTDTDYTEFIKQLAQLNRFMVAQTAGVRSDS